jgi:hypothetical protein
MSHTGHLDLYPDFQPSHDPATIMVNGVALGNPAEDSTEPEEQSV